MRTAAGMPPPPAAAVAPEATAAPAPPAATAGPAALTAITPLVLKPAGAAGAPGGTWSFTAADATPWAALASEHAVAEAPTIVVYSAVRLVPSAVSVTST